MVVVLEEFAEVLDVPIMDVTIDMIYLLFGFIPCAFPCEHHHMVSRTLLAIDADVRVVLPLVMTGTVLHFLAVVVLGGQVHLDRPQTEAGEGVELTALGAKESHTGKGLPEACAVTEDDLAKVVGIYLEPDGLG